MKRLIVILTTVMMMAFIPVPLCFAQTNTANGTAANAANDTQNTSQQADAKAGVITAFQPLQESVVRFRGTPAEKELLSQLPQTLSVCLDGSAQASAIPVDWEMVEDYDDTSYYLYSARPVWSDDYALSESLDPNADVPWIILYRQDAADTAGKTGSGTSDGTSENADAGDTISPQSLLAGGSKTAASNEKKIYTYLTETMGLNMAAACGVMTNLYAESGMQPNNLENTYNKKYNLTDAEYTKRVDKGKKKSDKGKYTDGNGKTRYFTTDYSGYGICQWTTSGRRTKVLKASNKKDVSVSNLNMQLGVLQDELEDSYPQVWATLQNVPNDATGVYLAAAHFCISYEVPANTFNTATSRAKTALSAYWAAYSGKNPSATGKSYMGICGYTYPKKIKKGTGMTVSGHVISNYKITSLSAKIVDSSGDSVYSKSAKPGAAVYSLYNFDKSIRFSKLSKGTYTYVITAKDAADKTIKVKHKFTVGDEAKILRGCATKDVNTGDADQPETEPTTQPTTEPATQAPSKLRGVDLSYPVTLKKGEGFDIRGKVKSDRKLKKVTITVKTTGGKKKLSASAKPSGKKTYNLKKLDNKISFGKLKKGTYYYIVKATDTKQTKQLLKKKFTVQ